MIVCFGSILIFGFARYIQFVAQTQTRVQLCEMDEINQQGDQPPKYHGLPSGNLTKQEIEMLRMETQNGRPICTVGQLSFKPSLCGSMFKLAGVSTHSQMGNNGDDLEPTWPVWRLFSWCIQQKMVMSVCFLFIQTMQGCSLVFSFGCSKWSKATMTNLTHSAFLGVMRASDCQWLPAFWWWTPNF